MKLIIGAAAAAFILAAAAPAFAQAGPAAPAAPAAPVADPYVSPCPHPAMETFPVIPDPMTGKMADIARAQKAYNAWLKPVEAFTECKRVELEAANAAMVKAQEGSPYAKKVGEYNAVLEPFNKAVAEFKASGVPLPPTDAKPIKPGNACPAAPAVTPAPALIDAKAAKSSEIKKAQAAFAKWRDPMYVYLQCEENELKALREKVGPAVIPFQNKYTSALADYEAVNTVAKGHVAEWNAFAAAYQKRLAGAGAH